MTVGPWYFFDHWLQNIGDGESDIFADDLYAVICTDAQALPRTFVGASTDCRYTDLTDELPTADGYTLGGIILPGKTCIRAAGIVTLDSDPWSWTITAPIAGAKYCVLVDVDSLNLDLVMACDLDVDAPGTNTVTLDPGFVGFTPHANGLGRWYQP